MPDVILNLLPVREEEKAAFEAAAPDAVHLYAGRRTATPEQFAQATIVMGWPRAEMLAQAPRLRWFHCMWAGTDQYTDTVPPSVLMTSSAGTNSQSVAEHMLASLLSLYRKIPQCRDQQRDHSWIDVGDMKSLAGATVLVAGAGHVGSAFAQLCKALGAARTIGLKRTVGGPVPGFDEVFPMERTDELLPQADVVALVLPHAPSTVRFMDRRRLSLLKDDAVLLSAGRGSVLDQEALADWEARLNTEAWNAAVLRMYTDPAEPTVSDGYLAENYPLYPREEGGIIPVTNLDLDAAERQAVNETGAVPTDIPLVPVTVHSGTEDGDTVTLEVSLAWANASGFTGGTLTIVDGEAVRFTTPLYEAAETAAREYLRQTAADLEAEGTAVADSRITALVRAVEYDFDDISYSAWYLRYELQSGSTGVWISESASLGLPVLLLREDPDGAVTLLETCFAGLLEPAGLSYSRTGEDIDGYTWEEYLYCKHHLGMALGTRVEGWPDTAAAFFLDLQAGRQSWTQDMTETALAYLGTQGYDLTAEDLEVTRRFSSNGSYRSDTALVAADCGDWTATLLLSQVHANGLDFWQVSGGVWTSEERRVSDPVGRRETALYEVEDVAFGQGVTGDLTLYGYGGNDVFDLTEVNVTWTRGRQGSVTFYTREAIADTWGEDSLDYATETALPDGGLLLEDLNFDGYLDIALQGWNTASNRPYYLWFCDLDSGMPAGLFTYGGCVNGPLTVDRENQRVVAETVDQAGALRYRHIYRPDGLGGLYLARQETWTLEGEDYVLTAAEDFRQEGASSRPLTEGELQALAAWFNLWSDYPENNGLLRFPYDTPEDAGDYLGLLFYDMGLSDWDYLEAAEREALAEAGLPEWMDLFKLPREEVNAYLREKFGIDEERADAILDSAADPPGPVYLEEYDAWYAVHTDTWYQRYIFQFGWELPDGSWVVEYINDFMASGPPDGEGAHSYWSDAPMRLVVSPGEDGWIVGSHQPAG